VAAAFAASSGGAAQREPERATLNQFRKTFKLLSSAFTLYGPHSLLSLPYLSPA
jgi:hypothetical protein